MDHHMDQHYVTLIPVPPNFYSVDRFNIDSGEGRQKHLRVPYRIDFQRTLRGHGIQ